MHFFASQEWNIEDRGTPRAAFVPTAAERAGDFSQSAVKPRDPLTGQLFPVKRLSQMARQRGIARYVRGALRRVSAGSQRNRLR